MSYVVTKLVTTEKSVDFFLLGAYSDIKQAAAAATEEYKAYNKAASFMNLEMVNEWLSTRGEYSFRRDARNRLQLDISQVEENQPVPAEQGTGAGSGQGLCGRGAGLHRRPLSEGRVAGGHRRGVRGKLLLPDRKSVV